MIGKDVEQHRSVGWGRGVCRQGEDGIMTGLSPLNRVCEGGKEKRRSGRRKTQTCRLKDWGFSFSGMG